MKCQKHLFNLNPAVSYINGAYMSPQLRSAEVAAHQALQQQNEPYLIEVEDFFRPVQQVKKAFAQLIQTPEWERIALIPSVSYGIGNVTNSIELKPNEKIILMHEQFPSNVYPWMALADKYGAKIEFIAPPDDFHQRGKRWNERILEAIDDSTAVVAMAQLHWTDGTKFDLKAIRAKTKKHGALLVIDGTQSVGAMPFDVQDIQPDALVCAAYKWLMGPYSIGVAYYGPAFDNGNPIEKHWLNRLNSEDFSRLADYQTQYRPKANRFSMGEQSNLTLMSMCLAGLEQLLDWRTDNIQIYCEKISKNAIDELLDLGLKMESPDYLAKHLFGVQLTESIDLDVLKQQFAKEQVVISYRGNAIRMSPNVYNEAADFDKLLKCFKAAYL